jgi:hypothetical protein
LALQYLCGGLICYNGYNGIVVYMWRDIMVLRYMYMQQCRQGDDEEDGLYWYKWGYKMGYIGIKWGTRWVILV